MRDTHQTRRHRILIVNCYFPATRDSIRLPYEVPNALAPVLLAAHCAPETTEVRLYNEVSDGHLEIFHPTWLDWPDLVVLSGLTCAFDRFLQLTAYFRTRNPRVAVAAGGMAVRSLQSYARQFFDYTCTGDVEELRGVLLDAFGPHAIATQPRPRYDLAHWIGGRIGYAESSRNCNYRCSFCSVTASGRGYSKLSLEHLRSQLEAMGKRDYVLFMDNQFHAHDANFFDARLDILRELRHQGRFQHWAAFVTDAFFWKQENLERAHQAGCRLLWVGVESFDSEWLARVNKTQNSRHEQAELAERCLDAGILFQYALVFDPSERSVDQMARELDIICADPRIPLPNVIFMAFPVPGTPLFKDRAERGLILPRTRVRDLEGSTLSLRPVDRIERVAEFVGSGKYLRDRTWQALRHQVRTLRRYRKRLDLSQTLISSITLGTTLAPNFTSNPRLALHRRPVRSFVSTTERLDAVYTPIMPLPSRFEAYFHPTEITNAEGELNEKLSEDLLANRYAGRSSAAAAGSPGSA